MSPNAAELEGQLSHIFQTASTWRALLLLDEADVFLQKRSDLTLERNRLVAIFLRKLEYFDGILFLTTNLVHQFDEAILNRIHLVLKYDDLDKDARGNILVHFLKRARTDRGPPNLSDEDLERLVKVKLNGRQVSLHPGCERRLLTDDLFQIKNSVAIAHALAITNGAQLSYSHICQALTANGYFIPDLSDTSVDYSLYE